MNSLNMPSAVYLSALATCPEAFMQQTARNLLNHISLHWIEAIQSIPGGICQSKSERIMISYPSDEPDHNCLYTTGSVSESLGKLITHVQKIAGALAQFIAHSRDLTSLADVSSIVFHIAFQVANDYLVWTVCYQRRRLRKCGCEQRWQRTAGTELNLPRPFGIASMSPS